MGIIATKGFQYIGVPADLIERLRRGRDFDTFIETGTYRGGTTYWAADRFKQVITIEASKEVYDALDKSRSNIRFLFGDSSQMLGSMLVDRSIVYLDAHYSADVTHNSYPLIQELKLVNASGFEHLAVIVDDARCSCATWNDETYGELPEIVALLSNGGARYVTLFDDMLVAVPRYMEQDLRDHFNQRSKVYWAQYGHDAKPSAVKQAAKKLLGR